MILKAAEYVENNEGYERYSYKDSEGIETIGIGFNLEEGFTKKECLAVLDLRLATSEAELSNSPIPFQDVGTVRKIVLLDMHYNLGLHRLLGFKKMIAALDRGDFELAALEMLDSRYALQVKGRAQRNAHMMRTGEWFE
jgi:lysozyme